MIFVSKIFPDVESDGPLPEVAVCGTLSLFCHTILASMGTFVSDGLKLGLPWTEAPCKIVITVAPATGAAAGAFGCCGALVSNGLFIEVTVPVPSRSPGFCWTIEAAGGFFAILCQLGTAIAAPTAITTTIMMRPCPIRLPLVLMMWFSSSVVIVLFTNHKWILHVCMFTTSCAFHQIDYHDYVRRSYNPSSNCSKLVHYYVLREWNIVKYSSGHSVKSQ